jgi:hypothetical protein
VRYLDRLAPLLALMAAVGCQGGADFYVRGTAVVVESDAPFVRHPDLPSRIESTVDAALQYWGGTWEDLEATTIVLGGDHVVCGTNPSALGCFDGALKIATADPGTGQVTCVEQTVLVHEVGHAVIGDPLHTDPRWMELEPVGDALQGRRGYTSTGEVDCLISLSVWRHPLNRP